MIRFTADGREENPLYYANHHFFMWITDPGWRAFAYCVSYTFLCFIPVWFLYRKKIFLKV